MVDDNERTVVVGKFELPSGQGHQAGGRVNQQRVQCGRGKPSLEVVGRQEVAQSFGDGRLRRCSLHLVFEPHSRGAAVGDGTDLPSGALGGRGDGGASCRSQIARRHQDRLCGQLGGKVLVKGILSLLGRGDGIAARGHSGCPVNGLLLGPAGKGCPCRKQLVAGQLGGAEGD